MELTELLFRQVKATQYQDGHLSSLAFRPLPKDADALSVDRSEAPGLPLAAQEAYARALANGWNTIGTWAITVGEAAALERPVYTDPTPDNPHHACVDFTGLSRSQQEKVGARLAMRAQARGQLAP